MTPYFRQSEGVNQYYKHNYTTAINLLSKTITSILEYKDFPNVMVANFYIGKSYWSLNQKEKAVPFLVKVDQAFIKQSYIRPDLRGNYELLINFYKDHNDLKTQLFYINRLLKVDSILNTNYKYLSGKVFKEYDTKKLLKDKKDIQQLMKTQKTIGFCIILLLCGVIAFLTYRHFKNRKQYSIKFAELMSQKPEANRPISNNTYIESELNLNPEVAETILKSLEKFEKNHKYLEKDMTLVKLAAILNTNQKYVTKIIAHYRGKKTIEYVSDLKIDYIVTMLKTQSKYRNYTNKALGEEAGFGSTQIFTKTFKNVTGMPPTFFINEIKKSAPNHI
jgi:AraC-like DNA-binding protein